MENAALMNGSYIDTAAQDARLRPGLLIGTMLRTVLKKAMFTT